MQQSLTTNNNIQQQCTQKLSQYTSSHAGNHNLILSPWIKRNTCQFCKHAQTKDTFLCRSYVQIVWVYTKTAHG